MPLAFTGGLLGLLLTGQQLTMISLMGFIVLMGTVVNNGIVFVDYTNQLRMGGMERRAALIATGKTRMRPILMTTLTTVLAMLQLVFSNDMASQLMSGMAIVIICGLTYATIMTLYVVPLLYDLLFKKPPLNIDVGSDDLDDIPDDAAEYIAQSHAQPVFCFNLSVSLTLASSPNKGSPWQNRKLYLYARASPTRGGGIAEQ